MRQKPSSKHRRAQQPAGVAPPSEIAALQAQGDVEAATRLLDYAGGDDRTLAKAARRALYALKLAGIEPPPSTPILAPLPTAPRHKIAQLAYATNVDGTGDQMFVFQQDDPYGGSPWAAKLVVRYGLGLEAVDAGKRPRREFEEMLDDIRERTDSLIVEIPVDYARHLLQDAAKRARETHHPLPKRFAEVAPRVGTPERDYPRPLIYDLLNAEDLRCDISVSHEPGRLFEQPLYHGWRSDIDSTRPWADRFLEAQRSLLHLEQYQLTRRADQVVEHAVDELLTEHGIADYRRRLEENALVLYLAGRAEEAKQALFQALTLSAELPPHSSAFARALVRRTIEVILTLREIDDKKKTGESGLIKRI